MKNTEVADRAMCGKVARSQHAEGNILVQLPRDLAGTEDPGRIAVDQELHHHRGMEWLISRTTTFIPFVERAQIKTLDSVVDVIREVALGKPVL